MNAYLCKLKFETAVHFGAPDSALSLETAEDHFCADTLFSALCHTALSMYGSDGVSVLCEDVRTGKFLLSDAMPWKKDASGMDILFIPRPMFHSDTRRDIDPQKRKAIKKLTWLPVSVLDAFSAFSRGTGDFDWSDIPKEFGDFTVRERAAISREDGGDSNPYAVGAFQFYPDCGLYFIALLDNPETETRFASLLAGLGATGIGGKTASGYGKFSLAELINLSNPVNTDSSPVNTDSLPENPGNSHDAQAVWLEQALFRTESPVQILLTTSLPRADEMETALDNAYFQMIRRAGFARPGSMGNQDRKKRAQYFLVSGSVLHHRFSGDLYPVGAEMDSPVFRYGRPIFLGLPE